MKEKIKFDVLESISKIYDGAKGEKIGEPILTKLKTELKRLSQYFKTTPTQAFFLSLVFALNYKKTNTIDFSDICTHLDSNPMQLLKYIKDFDYLCDNGFLIKEKSHFNFEVAYADNEYSITKSVSKAIIENVDIEHFVLRKFNSIIDVLEQLFLLSELRNDEKITSSQLFLKMKNILKSNLEIPFIKKIESKKISEDLRYLYYYLIWETLTGSEQVDIENSIEKIVFSPSRRIKLLQSFVDEKTNSLIKNNLVKIIKAEFINNSEMQLSEKSLKMLKEDGLTIVNNIKYDKDIIRPKQINKIKLFYNEKEEKQLELFQNALGKSNFKSLQKRLRERHLPNGITALLYGFPGTGKTESVLQIAKQTGRAIMKVDISQTKSMWFGESEKIIKRIFTNYYKFKEKEKTTPILFFNEADAIISNRQSVNSSNLAKTENTIQNIILEELELFDGIFIATTNLIDNMDSAFDRRFLFKVEFDKPNTDIKAKIWKSKLKNLKLAECKVLAKQFNFSGGQINNIVIKIEMSEVLDGQKKSLETIREFCEEEIISKHNKNKIGFTN